MGKDYLFLQIKNYTKSIPSPFFILKLHQSRNYLQIRNYGSYLSSLLCGNLVKKGIPSSFTLLFNSYSESKKIILQECCNNQKKQTKLTNFTVLMICTCLCPPKWLWRDVRRDVRPDPATPSSTLVISACILNDNFFERLIAI